MVTFGTFFSTLTQYPIALAAAPYSLSVALIGVAFLPNGVGGFLASPIAGKLSDIAAAHHPTEPSSRLMYRYNNAEAGRAEIP